MPRYTQIRDADIVLNYIKKLSPARNLSLKDLTLKLDMLLALTNAARTQTVHQLSVTNLKKLKSEFDLLLDGLLKQSRPGCSFSF